MQKTIALGAFLIFHFLAFGQWNGELVQAVEKGDLATAEKYLQKSNLANSFRPDYVPLIAIALQNKDRAMAKLLIDHGAHLFAWTGAGSPVKHCGDAAICAWFQGYRDAAAALHEATVAGDVAKLKAMAAQGYSVDLADSLHRRPLYLAAEDGEPALIEALLALGARPSVPWEENKEPSPLHAAANKGHLAAARLLIQAGANVNARASNGGTPLLSALYGRHPEIAILLIDNGADRNAFINTADYPVTTAAFLRDKAVLDLLLSKGVTTPTRLEDQEYLLQGLANFGDVELYKSYAAQLGLDLQLPLRERMSHDHNPLVMACAHDSLPLVQYMVEELHYDVNRISLGETPLTQACRRGHLQIARYLLDHGANIDAPAQSTNALGRAIADCKAEVIELLLQRGAKISGVNGINHPLQLACTFNCLAGAKLLMQYGAQAADGDCSPMQGNEAQRYIQSAKNRSANVMRAMRNKDYATVEAYLKSGGNPNFVHENHGLLEAAAAAGDLAGVQLLLRYHADPNFVAPSRIGPLQAAVEGPNSATILKALIAKGAKVNPGKSTTWSPLSWAAMRGNMAAVQTLLDAGANPNHKDFDQRPAWFSALSPSSDRILRLMFTRGADLKGEDAFGRNALYYAITGDTMLRALLAQPGIEVGDTDQFGLNILAYLRPETSIDVLELILRSRIDPNVDNDQIRQSVRANAATWKQMPEKVNLLRQHGFDPGLGSLYQPAFYVLAYEKQPAEFLRLLRQYHPPFDLNNPNYGPRICGAVLRNGDVNGLRFLLELAGGIPSLGEGSASMLITAYQQNIPDARRDSILELLLRYDPDLEAPDAMGQTLLAKAMQKGDLKWAQYLVIHGADPNRADRGGVTPLLQIGIPWSGNPMVFDNGFPSAAPLVKWMIQNDANPRKNSIFGQTLLMAACRRNDLPLAQYLIDTLKFPINDTSRFGESAFLNAVGEVYAVIIDEFDPYIPDIERGDDWNPDFPTAPSDWFAPRIPLVRYLLSRGADVNACTQYLDPMGNIYSSGHLDVLKECIAAGYNLNRLCKDRYSLLQLAVISQDYDFAQYLVKQGADPKVHFPTEQDLQRWGADARMKGILRGE